MQAAVALLRKNGEFNLHLYKGIKKLDAGVLITMDMNWFQTGPIPANIMTGSYNLGLVALSYVIAVFASYVALDLAGRIRAETNFKQMIYWLIGGAFAMGAGIWSMHFIGMLAFIMPMPMSYDFFWTGLSLLVAVIASAFALYLLRSKHFSTRSMLWGGIILGLAIVSMHYLGMEGMTDHVQIRYLPGLFFLSILIAIIASEAALWLANRSMMFTSKLQLPFKIGSALVMGAAICGMHYTGMAAAVFTPLAHMSETGNIVPATLAFSIAAITGILLLIALMASIYKQLLNSAVQNEKNYLNAILGNLEDGIIACDAKGKITLINKSLQRKFRLKKQPDYAKNLMTYFDFRSFKDQQAIREEDNPLVNALKERFIDRKLLIKSPDKKLISMIVHGLPIISDQDKILGAVIVLHDITERSRMENMKNEFVSTVSHELRTPLTSIRGSLGLILGGATGELNDKTKGLLDIAHNNCERLIRLINDILDIEKIEAGRMNFSFQATPLQEIIKNAIQINQALGEKNNINIVLKGDIPDIEINVDFDRLTQVITNLVSNAVKFSPKGGDVVLTATKDREYIQVEVTDSGSGIPKEFQNHIFEKFAQADSSTVRKQGGTGLGLSISKAIIEKMGGQLSFTSQEHHGTTFYFRLPIWHRNLTHPLPTKTAPKILVCEDDRDVASLLDFILTDSGFKVEVAHDIHQAKIMLEKQSYDAMTLDLLLPDGDGISLVQELRQDEKYKSLPIIIISGKIGNKKTLLNGDAINILDWLNKPIDSAQLSSAIAHIKTKLKSKKPYLLHIEDDHDLSKVVANMLQDEVDLKSVSTLHEAKELLEHEKFDLVLLDLILPDGSGMELLPLLCRLHIPVVVFSAVDLPNDYIKYVNTVLTKSRTTDLDLLDAIKDAISRIGDNHANT